MRRLLDERAEGYVAPESGLEARFLSIVRAAGLPEPLVMRSSGGVALDSTAIERLPTHAIARMASLGSIPVGNTPEQFAAFIRKEIPKSEAVNYFTEKGDEYKLRR